MTQQSSMIVVTLTSDQKTVVGNWSLKVAWSFPVGPYTLFTHLAHHVAYRVWSLRDCMYWCIINFSTTNLLIRSFVVRWIKTWYVESYKESKCALWICIGNGELKDIYFTKEKWWSKVQVALHDISFPLGSVGEWSPTSCWLMDYRLAIAVKNQSLPSGRFCTDYHLVGDKLKSCLRTIADWVTLFRLRVIWLPVGLRGRL